MVHHAALCERGGAEGVPAAEAVQSAVPGAPKNHRSQPGSAPVSAHQQGDRTSL